MCDGRDVGRDAQQSRNSVSSSLRLVPVQLVQPVSWEFSGRDPSSHSQINLPEPCMPGCLSVCRPPLIIISDFPDAVDSLLFWPVFFSDTIHTSVFSNIRNTTHHTPYAIRQRITRKSAEIFPEYEIVEDFFLL